MSDAEQPVNELALSRAWNAQWLRPDALRTTEGVPVTVVYRGRWTFNFGPDFQGAMIAFGAELRQGDVEVHLRAAGWYEHGHHLDAAYNTVILHAVLEEGPHRPCRRQDGTLVPTVVLGTALRDRLELLPPDPALPALGAIGDWACIAEVTPANAGRALAALERAGDARLTAKAAAMEAGFTAATPGQVLYAGLLDALGYSRNRAPMAALAAALPLLEVERRLPRGDRAGAFERAAALLLGVAGFLPFDEERAAVTALPPARLAAIEARWDELCAPWRDVVLHMAVWSLARVRPANHPVRRLLGLAAVLARCDRQGLVAACLEPCTNDDPAVGLAELRELLLGPTRWKDPIGRFIGVDRFIEMLVNIVLPFALAHGQWSGDERVAGGAAALWEIVPASSGNEQVRGLVAQLGGGAELQPRTGRQQQGALHLFRNYCQHRRCYECPIARLGRATSDE